MIFMSTIFRIVCTIRNILDSIAKETIYKAASLEGEVCSCRKNAAEDLLYKKQHAHHEKTVRMSIVFVCCMNTAGYWICFTISPDAGSRKR